MPQGRQISKELVLEALTRPMDAASWRKSLLNKVYRTDILGIARR